WRRAGRTRGRSGRARGTRRPMPGIAATSTATSSPPIASRPSRVPTPPVPLEPTFDKSPPPFGAGLPDPVVCDASPRALRQRTVNFAAKRMTDMRYVSGLDRDTAARHFRWRPAAAPGGLAERAGPGDASYLGALHRDGRIVIDQDDADRRVTITWTDPEFGEPVVGAALARSGYGSIVVGQQKELGFEPKPIARPKGEPGRVWPYGDAVETPKAPPAALAKALDAFFASSSGAYGVLIATPERVLCERYSPWSGPDRVTPSWSMTKAITCTV